MLLVVAAAAALLVEPPMRGGVVSRRGMVIHSFAAATVAPPAFAKFVEPEEGVAYTSKQKLKAELAAATAARKEEERIAALPITKLKAARDKIAESPALIENGDWDELRARIQSQSIIDLINSAAYRKADVAALKKKLLLQLVPVDTFAYKQQKEEFLPAILKDYCAPGVVPRDEPGACKVRPVLDTQGQIAKLKEALASLDEIIRACS